MESAVKSGWTAAEQVLADAGFRVTLAKEPRAFDGIGALVRPVAAWSRGQRGQLASPSP
jgi:hypothetical protein